MPIASLIPDAALARARGQKSRAGPVLGRARLPARRRTAAAILSPGRSAAGCRALLAGLRMVRTSATGRP
jgi:hypothetical protein